MHPAKFARGVCLTSNRNASSITYKTRPYKLHRLDEGPSQSSTISKEDVLKLYDQMVAIRAMENLAMALYRSKQIRGFCHLYTGQEAVAVGGNYVLRSKDALLSSYRNHSWAYLERMNSTPIMSELLAKSSGTARGKGGSMHIYGKLCLGGFAIVGAQVPCATGVALAHKKRNDGSIVVALYGDGAANQGQVFESFNMAKLWKLPCIYMCENNHFGMGTSQQRASASEHFYTRGDYLPGIWIDGNDVFSVIEATKFLIDYCASGKGPIVAEAATYRYTGHSMADPDTTYRTREDIQREKQTNDPIKNLKEALIASGVTEKELKAIEDTSKKRIENETNTATQGADASLDELCFNICINNIERNIRGTTPWTSHKIGVTDKATLP